jgi:hypothetical protein
MVDSIDEMELVEVVSIAEEQFQRGEGRPVREALLGLRQTLGISG